MVSDWLTTFYRSKNHSESNPNDIVAHIVIIVVVWTFLVIVIVIILDVNGPLMPAWLTGSRSLNTASLMSVCVLQ